MQSLWPKLRGRPAWAEDESLVLQAVPPPPPEDRITRAWIEGTLGDLDLDVEQAHILLHPSMKRLIPRRTKHIWRWIQSHGAAHMATDVLNQFQILEALRAKHQARKRWYSKNRGNAHWNKRMTRRIIGGSLYQAYKKSWMRLLIEKHTRHIDNSVVRLTNVQPNLFSRPDDKEARGRARELLLNHLTQQQREQYFAFRAFTVVGSTTGSRYLLNHDESPKRIGPGSEITDSYCLRWEGWHEEFKEESEYKARQQPMPVSKLPPIEDWMLAVKFLIENDEEEFLRLSHRTPWAHNEEIYGVTNAMMLLNCPCCKPIRSEIRTATKRVAAETFRTLKQRALERVQVFGTPVSNDRKPTVIPINTV